jgi:hypothetical protein
MNDENLEDLFGSMEDISNELSSLTTKALDIYTEYNLTDTYLGVTGDLSDVTFSGHSSSSINNSYLTATGITSSNSLQSGNTANSTSNWNTGTINLGASSPSHDLHIYGGGTYTDNGWSYPSKDEAKEELLTEMVTELELQISECNEELSEIASEDLGVYRINLEGYKRGLLMTLKILKGKLV